MRIFADLHNHSKYSRATSKDMDLEHQSKYAKIKGLNLLGSSDFTHPLWLKELKNKLGNLNNGIFEFEGMNWVLTAEISNIYTNNGKLRRIHHILLAPSFEIVDQINELLGKKGKLKADGRPIFGKYSSEEMVSDLKNISKDIEIIPAHAWTPFFSLFGSMSGYDTIRECYGGQLKNIHCIETGLSSDPAMNWRLSQLDGFTLVSNSDSHSYYPWRLGRECNVFSCNELSYDYMIDILRNNKLDFTIEVDPNYGKYHYDGHRKCNICLHPSETRKVNDNCPNCGKRLTIGVLHRVEQLADRPENFKLLNATPFKSILPLAELIKEFMNIKNLGSKKLLSFYFDSVTKFGNEFNILLYENKQNLEKTFDKKLTNMILLNRDNKVEFNPPGYDGEYGKPAFNEIKEVKNLKDYF